MLCLDQIYQTWLPCFFLGLSQGANWLVSKTLHGTQRGENQLLHDCWRESITFVSHTHMPYVNQVPTFQFYFWAMCRGQTCGLVVNELMSYVGILGFHSWICSGTQFPTNAHLGRQLVIGHVVSWDVLSFCHRALAIAQPSCCECLGSQPEHGSSIGLSPSILLLLQYVKYWKFF